MHHAALHCTALHHNAGNMTARYSGLVDGADIDVDDVGTATCLQHFAPHCNTLHNTAKDGSTLQYTAGNMTVRYTGLANGADIDDDDVGTAKHCNILTTLCTTLQHTATHCNTLQHTATHCRLGPT